MAFNLSQRGVRLLVYLYDFLLGSQNPHLLRVHAGYATSLLRILEWLINRESRPPSLIFASARVLGDPVEFQSQIIPIDKLLSLNNCPIKMSFSEVRTPLVLERLVGCLNFATFTVLLGRLHYRKIPSIMRQVMRQDSSVRYSTRICSLVASSLH